MRNKLVEFITTTNTVIISNDSEFNALNEILNRIKLPLTFKNYNELKELAKLNNCLIDDNRIIVEYQIEKEGYTIGYKTVQESTDWYYESPLTVMDIILDNFLEVLLGKTIEIDRKLQGTVKTIDSKGQLYGTWGNDVIDIHKNTIKLI